MFTIRAPHLKPPLLQLILKIYRCANSELAYCKYFRLMQKLLFVISFAAILALFSSCGKREKHDDKFVFRYNEPGGISSLDPAFARDKSTIWATNQLYNGLLQMDENLLVQPCIAQKFTIDSSGTHYTFFLRDDVFFHKNKCFGSDSTRAVLASDFVYSFGRLQNPALASPGRWTLDAVDTFWAANPNEFHVQLKYPFPPFAGVLTMKYCPSLPIDIRLKSIE